MNLVPLFIGLSLCLSFSAQALDLNQYGVVAEEKWTPKTYINDFKYDVLYYQPEVLRTQEKRPALVFMHGGGSSTITREGAYNVSKSYINGLKRLADELKFTLIVPSSSSLNWGGHTRPMLEALSQELQEDPRFDRDHIGLAGHSMGGMGITRSSNWLADDYAFFVPMSAGKDPVGMYEANLLSMFNTRYVHLQGLSDHFEIFPEREVQHLNEMKKLEIKLKKVSGYELIFYEGNHNYDLALFKTTLKRLFEKPIDRKQKVLYGSIYLMPSPTVISENEGSWTNVSTTRYFWLEAAEWEEIKEVTRVNFKAELQDDGTAIVITEGKHPVTKWRVVNF